MNSQQDILWRPTEEFIENSNLRHYELWLQQHKGLTFGSYDDLWSWSNECPEDFWLSLWEYFEIISHADFIRVLSAPVMPGARWFEGAAVNYAEHIFRKRNDHRPALWYQQEGQEAVSISWRELASQVSRLRAFLAELGIRKGDCVAAYLPNNPQAIAAFLAVNSLGAIWSCCSPDFGVHTVIDRFSQIHPKVLLACDGYRYGGKNFSRAREVAEIVSRIDSVTHTISVPFLNEAFDSRVGQCTGWGEVMEREKGPLEFEPVEFNHPIWVLYSSGTTGKPKAITHSHGGVLLEHLKYMHFHNDVKAGENFFWFTTTGWMMWNFLQASLLVGAAPVLYDGSPATPNLNALWKLAEALPIHHFGTSAPYLVACMKQGLKPGEEYNFSQLRSIGSTGAPLPPEAFDWVYEHVSEEVWLCSMSGGTDVCTAFVGGIPCKPVVRGRIQGRALGCDLKALSEGGAELTGSLGEMVITNPMPSMPVFFWGDENNRRYRDSYFEKFPGKWCHGDWIKVFEDGSLIIQGRSDATLNRKGIRIGTAEIYAVLDTIPGIRDSLIVNLEREGGEDYMPLFVSTESGSSAGELHDTIIRSLKTECSPRHVPDAIIEAPDIPYTLSGKKMEIPVKKALLGMDVSKSMNRDACRNPEAMDFFIQLSGKLRG